MTGRHYHEERDGMQPDNIFAICFFAITIFQTIPYLCKVGLTQKTFNTFIYGKRH